MEVLLFIALVIIIILLIKIKSFQKEIASRTHESFLSLKKELVALKEAANTPGEELSPAKPTDESVVQWRPYIAPEIIIKQVEMPPVLSQEVVENEIIIPIIPEVIDQAPITPIVPSIPGNMIPTVNESWREKWLRNNPDLEKFIGENLINKIGISVLVLGIAFFVKYAIDQNWINEAGRVGIGIGCGIILIALAHYLRNSYRSFSSVLAGGGIAVFYFTIAFAFHEYQLFSQTAAFVIMIIITVFAVTLSLLYDKLELAVIAAIGGFITPFLVSTGSGNYIILFTYLLILNIGMLALSWFKKWQTIHVIALFFTLCIYGAWLVQNTVFSDGFLFYKNAFLFATAFYILFLCMSMVYNIRTKQAFKAFDFSLLMLITFSYYAAGMTNLHFWSGGDYQGLFTIALGTTNLCLAAYFYRSKRADTNLLYLLLGLTLTFISLAAPVQLHGHSITLFWSAEFVLLYWMHQRSGIAMFKYSSAIVMILMMISLLMDWDKVNHLSGNHLPVLYKNLQGFITNIGAVIAFGLYAILLKRESNSTNYIVGLKNSSVLKIIVSIACILFYLTCVFGVNLYFYNYTQLDVPNTWHQLITYTFSILLLLFFAKYNAGQNTILQLLFIAGCIGFYLLGTPYVGRLRNGVQQQLYPSLQLWIHWISAVLLLYLIYQAIALFRKNASSFQQAGKIFIWIINIVLIIFFSVEMMHAYVVITEPFQKTTLSLQQYSKAGLTIVWALCSFTIMWLGMKHKFKTLRIISLVLLSLALAKLFLFDIRTISEGGKIAAFIMLGILLLIISFMYQKLKKIIIDDAIR